MLKVPNKLHFLCNLFGTFIYYAYLCNIKTKVQHFKTPAATDNSGTKDMTTIYSLTEWSSNMSQVSSKLFMTLNGAANWLAKQNPIDNQFNVTDSGIEGDYDINTDNLTHVLEASKANGCAASFTIKQDFVIQIIETRYTLSTIDVND